MKPFRKSLPPHLLRLNPKSTSATSSTLSKQTKPIFSSSFPNPNPTALSQTTAVPREDSISLLKLNSYHELSNTHLWNSSHQSKSVLYDPFSQRIIQARSFSVASSVSLSKPHINHEFHHTHFFKSIKEHKFVSKTIFSNPFLRKFHQARAFSTGNSNPDPEPSPGHDIPMVSTVASPFESSQPIDAGSSMRKPISLWPGMYHSPVTNALWEARSKMYEKAVDKPIDTVSQSELVAKSPSQSRTSILYKFSTDYTLKEQYRNPWNEVRMGKLVEDLDALAGTVSYKHCCSDDGSTMPILLVTASVDRMVLNKPIHVDSDLKIVGAVTWVGRSSMEIQMEVIQSIKDTPSPSESAALVANFTFVARDSKTGRAAPVNQILPETEHEKLLWKEAEERNKMRKQKKAQHKGDTQDKDIDRLYALLAEGRIFCDMPALADRDSILIKDTYHENSLICQPQQRNIHGRIFGGFLMRKAFELAFSNAYAFAGAAPRFVEVDHVDFLKPVDVGSFLRLKSCVLYTQPEDPAKPLINVEVIAHVTRPELRSSEVSNKFYFTFTIRPEAMKDGLRLRNVVPATEEEARRVLERIDAEEKS